jgi:hypothetical protein
MAPLWGLFSMDGSIVIFNNLDDFSVDFIDYRAIAVLAFLPIGFLRGEMGWKDCVFVVFAAVLAGGDRPSLFIP